MAGRWSETDVGNLLSFANGRASPERADELRYPVYGSNGIIGYASDANAGAGTIIIGRVGSYCGSLYQSTQKCWVTDNAIRAVAKNSNDPSFLFYLLRTLALNSRSTGSGQPLLNQDILSRIPVIVPEPSEQRAIAHILGSLDDKIELNRRRNQTLEAMARALFQDWFVDFGPVRTKMEGREPYLPADLWQLFPDRLDADGKPERWEPSTLAEFANLNPESWTKKNAPNAIEYVDLANTKLGAIEATVRLSWSKAPSRAQRVLRPGDTIVGTVRPGNGSYALIGREGLTGSTGFAVLRPMRGTFREFVFLAATCTENIERLSHLADGAAYPAVRPDVVLASPVVKPDQSLITGLMRGFSSLAGKWIDSIERSKRESQALAKLRDTLLPKLISGELRVDQLERLS